MLCATVLMRAQEFERSLDALSEAHDLLEPAVHGWLLALHDWIVAWNLALLGRLDDAEQAAHSSVERFDAQGEVWLSVDPLNILAGIAEARGDLDGASAAYEALLERCRAAGQRGFVLFSLLRLAALRARQGDDAAADGLYEEAIACSFNPSVSADVMVGQAAVARRLGDLARARALLDAAGSYYRNSDLPAGQTGVLAGLAWWALSAGQADDAMVFAADASQAAVRQRGPGNTTARRYRRSRSQGAHRPDPPQHRGLGRARSAARPEFAVPQSHQFHRRARCRRARGPPRASGSLSGDSAATAAAGRFGTFLRPWAPPAANRKSQLQISSRRLTSVSPQRRLRPARQTGIHAANTRSARQPA